MKNRISIGWFIAYAICGLIILFVVSGGLNSGINSKKGAESFNSLEQVKKQTSLNLDLPSWVDTSQIKEIRSTMGQMVEIRAEEYILKVSTFVDIKADPLGLYEKPTIDKIYTVSNSDTFIRYRSGYPQYENCTLVNWNNGSTAYGLMLGYKLNVDEALTMMNIDKSSLTEYRENSEESRINNENNSITYDLGEDSNLVIDMPKVNSPINITDISGYSIITIAEKICLVVIYNEASNEQFKGQGEIITKNNKILRYLQDNPFKEGTEAYEDFIIIRENINKIADSIREK